MVARTKTNKGDLVQITYPEIGVCGLSCRLCPNYHMHSQSRCEGCKSNPRMAVGCPFITCAVKKQGIEFCWDCEDNSTCDKWRRHRALGKERDSFKCYQKLEDDISLIQRDGVKKFQTLQIAREKLLREMLQAFNEGRSKSYYCIAATVLQIAELNEALTNARQASRGLDIKDKSRVLHRLLDDIASKKNYHLKLRK